MKSGIITGLNNSTPSEKKIKIDESTIYPCENCGKIMTLKQSGKISCVEGKKSFINAQGTIYYEHNFEEPVDTDHYIKYFREKHRLCWKEIYLKFTTIMCFEALRCTICQQWFCLNEMASCNGNNFHTTSDIDFDNYKALKQQIQVVDDRNNTVQLEKIMKNHPEIQYQEPQSMNFDKKFTSVYKEFQEFCKK